MCIRDSKIGVPNSYDVKAFGDCINVASKYSSKVTNKVKVSKKVKNLWPKSEGGTIPVSYTHLYRC